jgi:hypothetical protein
MQNKYNLLFQYYYGELSAEETVNFEIEMERNPELRDEYQTFLKTITPFDLLFEEPDPTSVEIISEYSLSKGRLAKSNI